jgi:hypothetical protein
MHFNPFKIKGNTAYKKTQTERYHATPFIEKYI